MSGFTGSRAETFEIFIQLGAILSVVWIYRERLRDTLVNLNVDPKAQRLVLNLAVASVPAAVLGFVLHSTLPAICSIQSRGCGRWCWAASRYCWSSVTHGQDESRRSMDMSWKDALVVGVAQSVALFPGVSRSGATIMGGMLGGMSRFAATEFSFFLAIPTMFAATFYSLF
ncbi:MAG: undecaprenyl-diphosphate phosphatase [Chromatiales bacterium]|nr:undecaprenyl-diphosphate phosphatase [Chromatiales bacterium]